MSRDNHMLLILCLLGVNMIAPAIAADDSGEKTVQYRSSGPYCGLYCLHSAIKLAGKDSDFADLIKPEYIGSREGSSLAELKQAAEDHGMEAMAVGKLTCRDLLALPYPIILHVKSSSQSKDYDHFELFLGVNEGKARIFDPPNPVANVAFHELARRWNGTGLIVSPTPIATAAIFWPARLRLMLYAAMGIAIVLGVHWIRRRWFPQWSGLSRSRRYGLSFAQCGVLALLAFAVGLSYHFVSDEGFLAHADATDSVVQAHSGNFLAKVSKKELQQLLNGTGVIIDARGESDFQVGHIEGAISIPVNSTDEQFRQSTTQIDKNKPVVVYCQSRGCVYDQTIALKLIAAGFTDVAIFKGGWVEWTRDE